MAGKITLYTLDHPVPDIRPAPVERDWMDATPQAYAYRCLPLNIANACGWEIGCANGFDAVWDGGDKIESIKITPHGDAYGLPISHFGGGVLTFHVMALLRTEPGTSLWVSGPPNQPKDAIQALNGVIETDWSPYTFTMNWRFTRPDQPVSFAQGEPFCFFFPIQLGAIEATETAIEPIKAAPELAAQYYGWSEGRSNFNQDLKVDGSKAQSDKWQKSYFRGICPNGDKAPEHHRTKIRVKPFR